MNVTKSKQFTHTKKVDTFCFAKKQKVTDELVAGIQFLFDKRGVKKIDGFGKLIDKNTIEVTKDDGREW